MTGRVGSLRLRGHGHVTPMPDTTLQCPTLRRPSGFPRFQSHMGSAHLRCEREHNETNVTRMHPFRVDNSAQIDGLPRAKPAPRRQTDALHGGLLPRPLAAARVRIGWFGARGARGRPGQQAPRARRQLRDGQGLRHHLSVCGTWVEHDGGAHAHHVPVAGRQARRPLRNVGAHRPRLHQELSRTVLAAALYDEADAQWLPTHVLGEAHACLGPRGDDGGRFSGRGRGLSVDRRRRGRPHVGVAALCDGARLHDAVAARARDPDRLPHRPQGGRVRLRRHRAV